MPWIRSSMRLQNTLLNGWKETTSTTSLESLKYFLASSRPVYSASWMKWVSALKRKKTSCSFQTFTPLFPLSFKKAPLLLFMSVQVKGIITFSSMNFKTRLKCSGWISFHFSKMPLLKEISTWWLETGSRVFIVGEMEMLNSSFDSRNCTMGLQITCNTCWTMRTKKKY